MNKYPKYANIKQLKTLEEHAIAIGDHGYVKVVDWMGGDEHVVRAARNCFVGHRSTENRTRTQDRRLIRRLMREEHGTPFEMPTIMLQIRLPMDIMRQFVRHRTFSLNEYSTRYRPAIDLKKVIQPHEWRMQSEDSKQGSDGFIDQEIGEELTRQQESLHKEIDAIYTERLELGVAREQARIDLPLANYTDIVVAMKARNMFHFLKLRTSQHAQKEIRDIAEAIAIIANAWMPLSYEAWIDYSKEAEKFSKMELQFLRKILTRHKEEIKQTTKPHNMTENEWRSFLQKINL